MVGHGGSSAGSYLADPTSPIPSHCASIVATSTARVNMIGLCITPQDSELFLPQSGVCINYILWYDYYRCIRDVRKSEYLKN